MANIWGNSDRLYLFGLQNCCRWWMNWAETFHLTICSIICYSFFPLLYLGSVQFSSVQLLSHVQLFVTVSMDCSIPGLLVHRQLLEFTQTQVHWVQLCHPTISSSDVPFSSLLKSFPASGSFQISQFFPSGSQSIGVSASASVLPMNI